MRLCAALVWGAVVVMGGTAAAQTPPPAPAPPEASAPIPSPPPSPPTAEPLEVEYVDVDATAQEPPPAPPKPRTAGPRQRNARLSLGMFLASPKGDIDDGNTETSPGFRAAAGYLFGPRWSGHVLYRRTYVQFTNDPGTSSFSTSDMGVGTRYTIPGASSALFFEGTLCLSMMEADVGGFTASQDGLGMEMRIGGSLQMNPTVALELGVSYLAAKITGDSGGGTANWLSGHLEVVLIL